jgi:hypothetical protein
LRHSIYWLESKMTPSSITIGNEEENWELSANSIDSVILSDIIVYYFVMYFQRKIQ